MWLRPLRPNTAGGGGLNRRPIGELSTEHPALQLRPQQRALSPRALHEAAVLLGAAGQVRDDLVHRAVGHVLVHGETCLTCLDKRAGTRGERYPIIETLQTTAPASRPTSLFGYYRRPWATARVYGVVLQYRLAIAVAL